MPDRSSRLPGFHALPPGERLDRVAEFAGLDRDTRAHLAAPGSLPLAHADRMIENVISTMSVPLAVATNSSSTGAYVLVPMATEEASVVAAASNGARMCRDSGGIQTSTSGPLMMAQIQALGMPDPWSARGASWRGATRWPRCATPWTRSRRRRRRLPRPRSPSRWIRRAGRW